MPNLDLSLPITVEPDLFGTNFDDEITGDTSEGGNFWLMMAFSEPQRIAIRYTRPDDDAEVVVQSVSVLDLVNAWVQSIEKELRQ